MRPFRRSQSLSARNRRRGAAMVEMAIVLPLFFMVVLGVVEFGRAMMVGQLVTNAAREGARMAITDGSTNADVQAAIRDFLARSANVGGDDVSVDITVAAAPGNESGGNEVANAQSRDLITVRVGINFEKVQYVSSKYLTGKQLVAESSMRHE